MENKYFSVLTAENVVEFAHLNGFKNFSLDSIVEVNINDDSIFYRSKFITKDNTCVPISITCHNYSCTIDNVLYKKVIKKPYATFLLSKIKDKTIQEEYKKNYNNVVLKTIKDDLLV